MVPTSKPRVTGLTWTGTVLTIDGVNFSQTNNRVWFTRTGMGTTSAVMMTGVGSTNNGTRIAVTPPVNAGSGDVLVRNELVRAARASRSPGHGTARTSSARS